MNSERVLERSFSFSYLTDPYNIKGETISYTGLDVDTPGMLNAKRNRNSERLKVIDEELEKLEVKKKELMDSKREIMIKQNFLTVGLRLTARAVREEREKNICAYCLRTMGSGSALGMCTPCGHVFCYDCVEQAWQIHAYQFAREEDDDMLPFSCIKCRQSVADFQRIYF